MARFKYAGDFAAQKIQAKGGPWYDVTHPDYGAVGDGVFLTDAAMTNGSAAITSVTGGFTSAHIGKPIEIAGAGIGGLTLTSTILAVASSTAATLADNAQTTVTGKRANFGTKNATAFQAAINDATKGDTVHIPRGTYWVEAGLAWSVAGLTFLGWGGDGTVLNFTALGGALFANGTDDGNAYDAANYNGPFAPKFIGLYLRYTGLGTTSLANGLAAYGTGTSGIVDWRGGRVVIHDCKIQEFEWGFWGIQSQHARFSDFTLSSNKIGVYLGPRSDQARITGCWSFHNDTVFYHHGSKRPRIRDWTTDSDGSATTAPVLGHASIAGVTLTGVNVPGAKLAGTRIFTGIRYDDNWYESLSGGATTFNVPAFFDLGSGDTVMNGSVSITDPIVLVNSVGTPSVQHVDYLVLADQVQSVTVRRLTGAPGQIPWTNMWGVFNIVNAGAATTVPTLDFEDADDMVSARLIDNRSTTAVVMKTRHGPNGSYTTNGNGGTGTVTYREISNLRRVLTGSKTWDPPSVAAGAQTTTTVTVTLAGVGDPVVVGFGQDLQGMRINGYVSASGTVTVVLSNGTAGAIDLASATLRVTVIQHS